MRKKTTKKTFDVVFIILFHITHQHSEQTSDTLCVLVLVSSWKLHGGECRRYVYSLIISQRVGTDDVRPTYLRNLLYHCPEASKVSDQTWGRFQEGGLLSSWISLLSKTRNPWNLKHVRMLEVLFLKVMKGPTPWNRPLTCFQYVSATLWPTVAITSFWIDQ